VCFLFESGYCICKHDCKCWPACQSASCIVLSPLQTFQESTLPALLCVLSYCVLCCLYTVCKSVICLSVLLLSALVSVLSVQLLCVCQQYLSAMCTLCTSCYGVSLQQYLSALVYSLYILLCLVCLSCSISLCTRVYSLYIYVGVSLLAVSLCSVYSLYIYGYLSANAGCVQLLYTVCTTTLYNYSVLSAVSALSCLCSVLLSIQRAPTSGHVLDPRVGGSATSPNCVLFSICSTHCCAVTTTTDGGAPPCYVSSVLMMIETAMIEFAREMLRASTCSRC
jgi:hypothetical protein